WRRRYQPSMEEVRSGRRPFVTLDVLHRENLAAVLADMSLPALSDADLDEFTLAWHRLDPWPDVLGGLARLKARYILAPHSNGNVALMVNMAKRAGLPWDAILGAEVVRHYKPEPASYRGACEMLGLPPQQVMLVAAHHSDLEAARDSCGMRTGFVPRPFEYGAERPRNPANEATHDLVAEDFGQLATLLGC
ncbi:MAG: haloacid dehalogenase type II, partial [Dehalococcoidia bacterium]